MFNLPQVAFPRVRHSSARASSGICGGISLFSALGTTPINGLTPFKTLGIHEPFQREGRMAKTPKNHGKDWTDKDVTELRRLAKHNTPTRVIALKTGRSTEAIYQKASTEGISLRPTNQSPYTRSKK
jgi:hypothetical protein